jgi:hypothetical protein
MKKQIAAAAFFLLGLFAVLSMKEPAGASQRVILANGGCPVPFLPLPNDR